MAGPGDRDADSCLPVRTPRSDCPGSCRASTGGFDALGLLREIRRDRIWRRPGRSDRRHHPEGARERAGRLGSNRDPRPVRESPERRKDRHSPRTPRAPRDRVTGSSRRKRPVSRGLDPGKCEGCEGRGFLRFFRVPHRLGCGGFRLRGLVRHGSPRALPRPRVRRVPPRSRRGSDPGTAGGKNHAGDPRGDPPLQAGATLDPPDAALERPPAPGLFEVSRKESLARSARPLLAVRCVRPAGRGRRRAHPPGGGCGR